MHSPTTITTPLDRAQLQNTTANDDVLQLAGKSEKNVVISDLWAWTLEM
jgi:hypothetical protein